MKKRLDQLLVEKKLFATLSQAQAAIMAGEVFVNETKVDKAGSQFSLDVALTVKSNPVPYVSRGGLKLEHAIKEFNVLVKGKIALDIGASTGGFTDCLLQKGVLMVLAVDVGYGQLDWRLRQDPRVKVFERVNARYLQLADLGLNQSTINLCVIDVSFISLLKILPTVYNLLAEKAEVIALIKPQFEALREEVGQGGVVRDEAVRQAVVAKIKKAAQGLGFVVRGITTSPIVGADGNIEYLIYLAEGTYAEEK
jgi:23S rRNA (cytidine1920-2'-O)/16S rRNA (cytidine1409-2'-O)-methyltransferase